MIRRGSKKHVPRGVSILHEDRDILVVDKPAGLLTVGTDREKERTLYWKLTDYVRKGNARSRERVFIVHRLDREASGLLVFARNEEAKRNLQGGWDDVQKTYLAIVHGTLRDKSGTIASYLTENRAHFVHSTKNHAEGKLSKTAFRVLKEVDGLTVLEIDLLTGRKHQIRVHLAESGHPIIGDEKYGVRRDGYRRLALHAAGLTFAHPFNGTPMQFRSEMPSELVRIVGKVVETKSTSS